ncbi:MAG: isoprenylcysteine carboxylmethyltransferase family protein [Terracidiphilus sp.]
MDLAFFWKILVYGWAASELLLGIATRTRRSGGQVKDRGSLWIIWVTIFLAIFAGETIRSSMPANIFGGAHWLLVVAMIVLLFGLAFRATAILSLGKAFSPNVAIRTNQKIYRGGLYRYLRHPAYTGSLICFLGLGIELRNWLAFFVLVAPITAVFLYRIHIEEIALNEAFGEEYASYSQQTKRLIPGIY